MAYDLSFSPEFFFAEGEPYDGGPNHGNRPTSVWGAIELAMKNPSKRRELARILKTQPQYVTEEAVMDLVQSTNTCSNLNSPVEVWVDPDGDVRLKVYDSER